MPARVRQSALTPALLKVVSLVGAAPSPPKKRALFQASERSVPFSPPSTVSDAWPGFQLLRAPSFGCQVQHIFLVLPRHISLPLVTHYVKPQTAVYGRINNIACTPSPRPQIQLLLRFGYHSFKALSGLCMLPMRRASSTAYDTVSAAQAA